VEGQGDVDLGEIRLSVLAEMLDKGRKYIHRHEEDFLALADALK
jgi:hypothetical protein